MLKKLFELGLLPGRYTAELPWSFQERRSVFFGMSSAFERLHPVAWRYLERKKITYRIKNGYRTKIKFWTKEDYDLFMESAQTVSKSFYGPKRMGDLMREADILFREESSAGARRYSVFSPASLMEIMLRYEHTSERGYTEFFL